MTVNNQLIPLEHLNRPGTKLEALKAIVFHYTENDSPDATDTMNAQYFGRKWTGPREKPLEANGRTPFRYGSTQVLADEDSVTIAIPIDEAAWACGDRKAGPWTPELKGQMPVAARLFANRQNFQSISVEICNNGSWVRAVENAAAWAIMYLRTKGLTVDIAYSLDPQSKRVLAAGSIVLLCHFNLTGKVCPKPFVDDPDQWEAFVRRIAAELGQK